MIYFLNNCYTPWNIFRKENVSHIYFFIEDYKAIAKFSKIVIFLLCGTMTIFINRHNLVFMNRHGNGTMNTLLTIRGEIIGENVKFYLLQFQPVHSWNPVTLVHAIHIQCAHAQKDLEGLDAEIVSIQWLIFTLHVFYSLLLFCI